MSQKRKAYTDLKTEILQDICTTYRHETTAYGLERFKIEANVRGVSDKDLIRIIDRAYIELAISIVQTYKNIKKIS